MTAQSSVLLNADCGLRTEQEPATSLWCRTQEIFIRTLDRLGEWQQRAAERRMLMTLDDRVLGDLGLNRDSVDAEASKPFWKM